MKIILEVKKIGSIIKHTFPNLPIGNNIYAKYNIDTQRYLENRLNIDQNYDMYFDYISDIEILKDRKLFIEFQEKIKGDNFIEYFQKIIIFLKNIYI